MCRKDYNIYSKKGKHLNYDERCSIERWYNIDKRTKVEIAKLLDRNEKTIRNEIKRGLVCIKTQHWEDKMVYSADIAQQQYNYYIRAKGPQLKIDNDYKLKEYVEEGINKLKKSPEVIAKEINEKEFKVKICAKTIRNCIRKGFIFDIKPDHLIYKKIYKNKNKEKRKSSTIPPEKSIEYRPIEANLRSEYGHWEGDLVIGKRKKSDCLLVFTERMTREEIIFKISGKKSENVVNIINKMEDELKEEFYRKFKTITFDNGGEFRDYENMEKSQYKEEKRLRVYYAHPYCSGERGSNENNNRLIRRFIPKGTDISEISESFIKEVENWINNYPRKIFKYLSANDMLKLCYEKAVI